ncbi:hypothetical protein DW083_15190 [Parabacteroides sp. AF48-14]|uniref:DUF6383 domain-containing protein n=1 Tax=Parabacteroides sp. AF48-14 TaxID=2292052 RepID=UPI000F00BF45|nr:DUF6383 domain-containing protein [Parabacteroides sp. AF48-14]RHO69324.1 hypothetical protein DW083_15190 [Parabacteroides sp. AF48-14]
MNKRFSTLLTAFLLMVGALFGTASAAVTYSAASGDLAEGLKVYLGDGSSTFLASEQIGTTGNYTFATGTTPEAFTVTGLKKENGKNLFKLVNAAGKTIYGKIGGTYVEAAEAADVTNGNCWFSADDAAGTISLGDKPLTYDMSTVAKVAKMLIGSQDLEAADLNKNLSGKGFSFSFPNAKSEAEVNPFADNMVAVDASIVQTALTNGVVGSGTYTNVLCFVKADAAGLAYLAATDNADKAKAATFVVLNPQANFGITGLVVASGEGFGFTTVKGSKLAENNKNADGKIAFANAVYKVSEGDILNAAGEYTIEIAAGAKVKSGSDENTATIAAVYVGAYSLTTGGLKTYITTVLAANADDLSLAMTSSNTWAKASDVLSATDATIVNLSFLGTMPADATEAAASLYGKYLVPVYGAANFTAAVAAPKDVDVNAPLSQWVVSAVSGHDFTFTNRETNVTFTASLYKTDKVGEYLIGSASMTDERGAGNAITTVDGVTAGTTLKTIANWGGQIIKLTATTDSEGFMTLTDAQLEQQTELVFNGAGTLAASKLYMMYDAAASSSPFFLPTNDATKGLTWFFEKAESVKNKIKYAYLKDDVVTLKDSVVATAPSYLMYKKDNNNVKTYFGGVADDEDYVAAADKDANAKRCYFKKNVDGTYALITAGKPVGVDDAAKYKTVVKGNIAKMSVNVAGETFATTEVLSADAAYSNITVDFNTFTESLESVARHATLDSEDGAVSMKLNKNGILEGIVAGEGLTFWLDTADIDQEIPSFYISKGNGEEAARSFLFYATDSLTYWDAASATYKTNENYYLEGSNKADMKAIFRPAALAGIDTIATTVAGEAVKVAEEAEEDVCLAGIENFKFYIMKSGETSYVIRPMGASQFYLYNLNGKLGFTNDPDKALVITLGNGDATSSEEAPAVATIKVVAGEGNVQIAGAAGKKVVVSNILGQVIANTVVTSDNATIAAPAGIVVVAVEGEAAVKAIVK